MRFVSRHFNTPRLGFLQLDTFEGSSHTHIGAAVNLFLRHQLLDQLLDSVNFPLNADRVDFPSVSAGPKVTKTLQGVRFVSFRPIDDY